MVEAVIGKCKERGEKYNIDDNKDFLQFLLHLKEQGDVRTRITMAQLKALLNIMILAGTDTTTATLELAKAAIVNKPEVMRRAQQELEAVVRADNQVMQGNIRSSFQPMRSLCRSFFLILTGSK